LGKIALNIINKSENVIGKYYKSFDKSRELKKLPALKFLLIFNDCIHSFCAPAPLVKGIGEIILKLLLY